MTTCTTQHLPIIIGVTLDDCEARFRQLEKTLDPTPIAWRGITLRTDFGRGFVGPVFTTIKARSHQRWTRLFASVQSSGLTCDCYANQPGRVA